MMMHDALQTMRSSLQVLLIRKDCSDWQLLGVLDSPIQDEEDDGVDWQWLWIRSQYFDP
jgi:hypothetical protein